jgi:hypothetical protein
MKKLLLTAFAAAIMLQVNGQTYTPVAVTGFSADVIANGAGSATSSTSIDFDGSGYNLVAQNFVSPTNQTPVAFLPTNGIINSAATTGLTFQLAPYTGNNSLRITGTGSGTLTFATPISAGKIYLLGTSVYLSTFTATVNFTDGTNQPFTNLTMERWGVTGVGTVAKQTIGKVLRATSLLDNPAPAPSLYQIMLTLTGINTQKPIQSITFTKTSPGTGEILHILGISVQAPASLAPNDVSASAITGVNSGCGLTSQETVTVTVANLGSAPQSNIPVSYSVNGTPVGTGTIAGPVAPGATAMHTFSTKANLSTLGTYAIEAKSNLAGDATPTNDALTKTVISASTPNAPAITVSGPTSLCTSGSITLTAASTSTGVTYQWFKDGVAIANAISATYYASIAGSYTATAIIAGNCSSPVSTATVITQSTSPNAPAISAGGPLAICVNNSSVTFTAASVAGATITWFKNGNVITGATSNTYTATTAGSYTATATLNGCGSPASSALVVTTKTTPSTPSISQAGMVLTSSSTANNQWYLNGVLIAGATNRTYTATANGSYTVVVTSNGCSSAASAAVTITSLGVNDELNTLKATISPNPSTGLFQVELPKGQAYEMLVTDLTGKVILSGKTADSKTVLDLNGKAKGVYLLKLVSEGKTTTRKLEIE